MIKNVLFILWLSFNSVTLLAQTDNYPGIWKLEDLSNSGTAAIQLTLHIANPEKNLLYPAQLKIQSGSFTGVYELLLARKNNWELAISKNKFAESESPFSLEKSTQLLNGIFDYSKDFKAVQTLTLKRYQQNAVVNDLIKNIDSNKNNIRLLINFLNDAEIKLVKQNNIEWQSNHIDAILSSGYSPGYFGLKDTVYIKTKDGSINLSSNKKNGNDIVSVRINGKAVLEQISLSKKNYNEEILLDTGLNTLCFFAENFSNNLPNNGKLKLELGKKNITLDFNNKLDSAANFIIVKLYFEPDRSKENNFQNYYSNKAEPALQANEKLICNLVATSQQLTLALWDDAVEDGDSISINIDGRWIVQGFPVKKNPQFIKVTLKPGHNTINFIADNLGSIPPNTSILEIIDGNKRKSFTLETTLGENNLLKIYYDIRPEAK